MTTAESPKLLASVPSAPPVNRAAPASGRPSVEPPIRATSPENLEIWLERIRAEYREIPGLHLTRPQARRLWGLNQQMCDTLLDLLERAKYLKRTQNGGYVRRE